MASSTALPLVGLVLFIYSLWRTFLAKSARRPLPPGPRGVPLLGNLFDWPTSKEWETFSSWQQLYGDIIYANVAGNKLIVLNSYDAAVSMLIRKGPLYSERPSMHFLSEMVGWKYSTIVYNQGPNLKEHRRLFSQHIGSRAALGRFAPTVYTLTREFISQTLNEPSPNRLLSHIRRLNVGIILDMTYGYQIKEKQDDLVLLAEQVMNDFTTAGVPGAHLVDAIPWLERLPSWFPGTNFKVVGAEMRHRLTRFVETPFLFTRDQVAAGTTRPSLVGSNIEGQRLSADREHNLKWAAMTIYAAGADTSTSALYSFFLFMTLFPEVQAKAQAEIDAVVGKNRLPTASDRDKLPYLDAVIKEIYRCGSVIPQGAPHRVSQDDVHDGYFIPKDTVIITNIWFMCRDPRYYKNPDVFDPSRHLGDRPELDPRSIVFGFGRRICPGRFLADENVFLACAMALATTNISKAVNSAGIEITPTIEFSGGLTTHAEEFPFKISARSAQAETLLRSET